VKIATWNVNSLKVRLPHVLAWLEQAAPDVLALQETKTRDEEFPADAFTHLGYTVVYSGQPTYNGVAVLARAPIEDVAYGAQLPDPTQKRALAVTVGGVRVWNVYVPNGQSVESEKYRFKLDWLAALRDVLQTELARHRALVVLGDFNIAPEDRDVHDPAKWEGQVLCTPAEREALRAMTALGLHDVFRLFEQPERSYSWWDYRAGAFRRNQGLRIDLILASDALREVCTAARIDREPRGWERPSDHVPVVADFAAR
jgi:exodeoxyribonuclease-3